jgi:hypothetical protein
MCGCFPHDKIIKKALPFASWSCLIIKWWNRTNITRRGTNVHESFWQWLLKENYLSIQTLLSFCQVGIATPTAPCRSCTDEQSLEQFLSSPYLAKGIWAFLNFTKLTALILLLLKMWLWSVKVSLQLFSKIFCVTLILRDSLRKAKYFVVKNCGIHCIVDPSTWGTTTNSAS